MSTRTSSCLVQIFVQKEGSLRVLNEGAYNWRCFHDPDSKPQLRGQTLELASEISQDMLCTCEDCEHAHGQVVKYEIWDTAGQERYKSLAPMLASQNRHNGMSFGSSETRRRG